MAEKIVFSGLDQYRLKYRNITLDLLKQKVSFEAPDKKTTRAPIAPRETQMLALFMLNPGTTISRKQIKQALRLVGGTNVDQVSISRLRKVLAGIGVTEDRIHAIDNKGYLFV